nr:MAG TPA: hypothetical protein [Caudoviricetes sp.]
MSNGSSWKGYYFHINVHLLFVTDNIRYYCPRYHHILLGLRFSYHLNLTI